MLTTTFVIISLLLFVALIMLFFKYNTEKTEWEQKLQKATKEAVAKSKSVIRGNVSQEVFPLMPDFPYVISDLKFSGQPLDYIVFDGMSEFRDGNKEKEINIVFADVKYGKANKTPVQREIANAIKDGRVRFEEWKIDENNKITIK